MKLGLLVTELIAKLKNGKIVFFVGAGISKPSPTLLPLGNELLSTIILNLGSNIEILKNHYCKPILDSISKGDKATRLEVLLDIIQKEINDKSLEFLKIFDRNRPNKNHYFLAKCLSYGNIVITTNIDNEIENACNKIGVKYFTCFEDKHFNQLEKISCLRSQIIKLHGTIKDQQGIYSMDNIILTLSQVGKGLSIEKANVLECLLKKFDFMFLGYSGLDDFDIYPKLLTTESLKKIFWMEHKNSKRLSVVECKKDDIKKFQQVNHITKLLTQRKNSNFIKGETSKFINILSKKLGIDNNYSNVSSISEYNWIQIIKNWAEKIEESHKYTIFGDVLEYQGNHLQAIKCYKSSNIRTHSFQVKSRIQSKIGWVLEHKGNYSEAYNHFYKSLKLLKNIPNNIEKINALYNLGWIMQRKGKYKKSISFFREALDYPENKIYIKEVAEIYNGLGATHWYLNNWEEAIQHYEKNIDMSEEFGDIEGLARGYNNIGLVYWKKGNYDEALDSLSDSLDIYLKIGNLNGIGSCYSNLGIIYRIQRDWKNALKFQRKSIKIQNLKGNRHNEAISIDCIGNIYFDKGNMRKALENYKECRKILLKIDHPIHNAMINHHIGKVYKELGKLEKSILLFKRTLKSIENLDGSEIKCDINCDLADALLRSSKNINLAFKYGFDSLDLSIELKDKVREGIAKRILAELYLLDNNINEAERFIKNSVKLLNDHLPLYEIGRSYLTLSKVFQKKGDTSEAKIYLEKSRNIK